MQQTTVCILSPPHKKAIMQATPIRWAAQVSSVKLNAVTSELTGSAKASVGHIDEWHLVRDKACDHIAFDFVSRFSEKRIVFGSPFS